MSLHDIYHQKLRAIRHIDRCWFIRLLFMARVFELGIFQPRMDANARESWNVIRVH